MESCSSFFLPRMVGYSNATYLLTTGKRFPAHTPVLHGIFAELLPEPKDVLPRALELAQDIITNVSTMAVHLNRQLIWRNPGSVEGAHLVDSPLLYDMFGGRLVLPDGKAFAPGIILMLIFSGTTSNSKKHSSRSVSQLSQMHCQGMRLAHILGGMSCQFR